MRKGDRGTNTQGNSGSVPGQPALNQYRAKRNFSQTPEPDITQSERPGAGLRFVIQKHWASRLHYDFRLELDGVLKSWAVPKGPSLDPRDKRMAVEVEDHPLAYADFEGVIPPGHYGAGKVIIWDAGHWHPLGDPQQGYADGHLKFELTGNKLSGRWALVRMKGRAEKQKPWLLLKEKDSFARPAENYSVVDDMPDSVLSLGLPPEARPAQLPAHMAPQLATLVDKAPQGNDDWRYEIKFDGYRMLARLNGRAVQLFTRNGHDWTSRMPEIAAALAELQAAGLPAGWYDGEVVVLGSGGVPDFQALQRSFEAFNAPAGEPKPQRTYFLFDLPFVAGHDLRAAPQEARSALLRRLLESCGVLTESGAEGSIRLSEAFHADPADVVQSACRLGLEGVIGKRRDAPYLNRRSPAWIKLKCGHRQEFVIGGYTEPGGARVGWVPCSWAFTQRGQRAASLCRQCGHRF